MNKPKLLIEDDESASFLRPRGTNNTTNINNNQQHPTQRSGATDESVRSANVPINILKNHPTYSSINDDLHSVSIASFDGRGNGDGMGGGNHGGHSTAGLESTNLVDMEALLTMALETTTQKVDRENKRRQNVLLMAVGVVFLLSLCILSTVTLTEYPDESKLHNQIDTLESEVDELHGQLDTFENDENIDILQRDIEDKKLIIQELEHDQDLDPKEKQKLVDELEDQIEELRLQVQQLELNEEQMETYANDGQEGNVDGTQQEPFIGQNVTGGGPNYDHGP